MKKKKRKLTRKEKIIRRIHDAFMMMFTELSAMAVFIGAMIADYADVWIPVALITSGSLWLFAFNYANHKTLVREVKK